VTTTYTDDGLPDVVGSAEARRMLGGVSRQRFSELRGEDRAFPPARELAGGPVWDRATMLAYAQDRHERTRYGRGARTRLLQSFRKRPSIYAAAKSCGVPQSTARRWLIEAGAWVPNEGRQPPP
jgi:hypothetical protein